CADKDDDEEEADDSGLAQILQHRRVRLDHREGRVPLVAVDQSERSGPAALRGMVDERVPRLLPPAPAVARARADETTLIVRHLGADRVRKLLPAVAREVGR